MTVGPKLCVRWTFLPDTDGERHTCVLLFAPTWDDWIGAKDVTEEWYQRGWCTYDERQMFLNEVNQKIDKQKVVKVRVAG